jgi:hypothetical protein
MNVKQNEDKTITKATCHAEILNPETQARIAKVDFKLKINLPSGHRLDLDPKCHSIKINSQLHEELTKEQLLMFEDE